MERSLCCVQAQMEADQKQLEKELANGGGNAGGDGGDAGGDGKPTSPVEVCKHCDLHPGPRVSSRCRAAPLFGRGHAVSAPLACWTGYGRHGSSPVMYADGV